MLLLGIVYCWRVDANGDVEVRGCYLLAGWLLHVVGWNDGKDL